MRPLPTLDAADFTARPSESGGENAALTALGEAVAERLTSDGACWIANWPPPAMTARLREDLIRLRTDAALEEAAVGRLSARAQRSDVRGDRTCWLDDPRCGAVAGDYLAALTRIRTAIDRRLFLGLVEFEAHYAAYPPGARYARHRDRFRDSDARVVSWVSYLNPEWHAADGGALRLYLPNGDGSDGDAIDIVDLPPIGGSVCFLSELEHEVLVAHRERHSIAGWMRRRARDPL
jgi:SM-20-related protein